jgi:putative NIF3 family GTP cyclohydrolase 1 type 2
MNRRCFTLLAGSAAIPLRGAAAPTAQDVVQRIQTILGGEWPATGPDSFKAGDPSTPVRGIATTAMATVDVLKQASKAGMNLVLTYEPTFFGRQDGKVSESARGRGFGGVAQDDPVYKAKREFIEKNGLVVFRLRDHWESRKENDMVTGLADSLGWSKYRVRPDDVLYDIPEATAEETVAAIRKKLNLRGGLRAVGDRTARVRRVMLHPGAMTPAVMWQRYSEADLLVAGEVREWENTFYAADIYTAGEKRGLVTIGRVVSEDAGMRACADWLKTVAKEIAAQWIPAGDLYWRAV